MPMIEGVDFVYVTLDSREDYVREVAECLAMMRMESTTEQRDRMVDHWMGDEGTCAIHAISVVLGICCHCHDCLTDQRKWKAAPPERGSC